MKLLKTMTLSYMYPVNLVGGGQRRRAVPSLFHFFFLGAWGR